MSIQPFNASFSVGDVQQQLAVDPQQLNSLKAQAIKDPKSAARQVASQFEALLMNTLLKSMRETRFDQEEESNSLNTYQSMYDQQITQAMSAAGGVGLGDMLYRQIAKQSNFSPDDAGRKIIHAAPGPELSVRPNAMSKALHAYQNAQTKAATPVRTPETGEVILSGKASGQAFVQSVLPHAKEAASKLGVVPEAIVAHAALESGWGKRAIRYPDGKDSHNLFGIKATGGWQGKTVSVMTTEYERGVPQKRVEKFRAYDSYAESFNDYARLLAENPRYKNVLNQGQNMQGFAQSLQSAGYATDPRYARKLVDVAATLVQRASRS